jgi:hypothetical protein
MWAGQGVVADIVDKAAIGELDSAEAPDEQPLGLRG